MIDTILRKRYKVVKTLGSGGFGDTYLAEDLDLPNHPKCVVKHLRPKSSQPEVLLVSGRLFEREAQVLYRLGNLSNQFPKLFAHFEENGEFYLVQEFIDGHDLSVEIIPDKQWNEVEVVQLLQQILEVLAVLHQQNIIHRDIKPQNLMRSRENGNILLIDFGAVKEIEGLAANSQGEVSPTIAIGTNGYMPNEQANSKPRLCSDIYAVGMVAIQALTGKLPQNFPEDPTSGEIIWRNEANVNDRLADILTKMVRSDFSQRYQSPSEVLQALKLAQPSLSVLIPIPRQLRTNQKVLIGAGVGAIGLFGVGLLFVIFSRQATPNLEQTVTKPIQATPDLGQPATESIQATPNLSQPPTESSQATPDVGQPATNVQLICPETPVLPLPSTPSRKTPQATFYGLPNVPNPTGKGIIIYRDVKGRNIRYDGELKNGKFNGCGTYTFASDDRYIGQFKENVFQGMGKFIYKKGCQYIGGFEKNHSEGQGIFIDKDGIRYSGNWHQGKFQKDNRSHTCE